MKTEVQSEFPNKQEQTSSFWLTRIVFVRCLSLVYHFAFISAFQSNKFLIGDDGLTPLKLTLEKIEQRGFDQITFPEFR